MGQIHIGHSEEQKFGLSTDYVRWAPLTDNQNYWNVAMKEVSFGDQKLNTVGNVLMVDTGTSYSLIP